MRPTVMCVVAVPAVLAIPGHPSCQAALGNGGPFQEAQRARLSINIVTTATASCFYSRIFPESPFLAQISLHRPRLQIVQITFSPHSAISRLSCSVFSNSFTCCSFFCRGSRSSDRLTQEALGVW